MLSWTERSMQDNQGVDHLGMRVAGESCYSSLVDFTTTVSWRPRYFPFYCWAAKQAFARAGGRYDDDAARLVDPRLYQQIFKHLDFAMVAATLVNDVGTERVVGSKKLAARIRRDPFKDGETLALSSDHVQAGMGGFGVYAGPMRQLGLLSSAQGFDIPFPGTIGDELADAFDRSYAAAGVDVFGATSLSQAELERLGELCGLDQFVARANKHATVARELELTRGLLVDWRRFAAKDAMVIRRVRTLGVILEMHRLAEGRKVSLETFRAATLLGHARFEDMTRIQLSMPRGYEGVLGHWKIYQAHAYATLALESLLSLMLFLAEDMSPNGNGVGLATLLSTGLTRIQAGLGERGHSLPKRLRQWTRGSLSDCVAGLRVLLDDETCADEVSEPALQSGLWRGYWSDDIDVWAHDSALLLLLSVVRLSQLPVGDWLGHQEPARMPPRTLARDLLAALDSGVDVLTFLREILKVRVLEQHRRNALRKLFDQPTVDSQKFIIEGSRLFAVSQLEPGTSNPRFDNAVMFLAELGYLNADDGNQPTAEGRALLDRLEELGDL